MRNGGTERSLGFAEGERIEVEVERIMALPVAEQVAVIACMIKSTPTLLFAQSGSQYRRSHIVCYSVRLPSTPTYQDENERPSSDYGSDSGCRDRRVVRICLTR